MQSRKEHIGPTESDGFRTRDIFRLVLCTLFCITISAQHVAAGNPEDASSRHQQTILDIQKRIEAGELDQARSIIAAALRTYPHDGGMENLLGIVEAQQGNTAAATKAFSDAIMHAPRLAAAYLNLSRLKMDAAQTDRTARTEALRLSQRVVQLDPTNDEAHYQLATILLWNKDYRGSLEHLHKLIPESRSRVAAQALLCADSAALDRSRDTEDAVATMSANPELTEADVAVCMPFLRAAKRADLIDRLLTATARNQTLSPDGLRLLGLAQEAEGQLQSARTTLESAFAADPKSIQILSDLARIARAANDNQGALGYLAHARDLNPKDSSLAFEFGAVCVRMGLYGEARKALAEALRLEPNNPRYNFAMGTVVSFSSDPSQSLPYLRRYQVLHPKDAEGILALGTASFRAKEYETAAQWLRQAALNEKTAPEAYFYLGRIARQEGRGTEAVADLKRSLALRPDQPDVLAELGQISTLNRDFAQAASYFEQALRIDPDNYSANFGLLQLYARTGDARREQQSHRFDELKQRKEEQDKQMMRVLEIRRDAAPDTPQ